MDSQLKNAYFADSAEKNFGLLNVTRTQCPNGPALVEFRAVGSHDERAVAAISGHPGRLAEELREIAEWLDEATP